MNRIFISYRRNDSVGYSGRLADQLAQQFGQDQVFRDYDDIRPGQNFVESLKNGLSSADILLVMISHNWLIICDDLGQRCLNDSNDFVRLEIELALQRNIHIIPILINGTPMPNAQDLPPSLAGLALRQAVPLSDSRWEQDAANLILSIRSLINPDRPHADRRLQRLGLYLFLCTCILIAILTGVSVRQTAFSGHWYFEGGDYLAITQQGEQFNIEHINPAMQTVYEQGVGRVHGLTLEFNLDPTHSDRFKYQGSLRKSWDGQVLQGELLEILSDQRSGLTLKKQAE